jgi:hypothetical protein
MNESLDTAKQYIIKKMSDHERWRKKGRHSLKRLYRKVKEKYEDKDRKNPVINAREYMAEEKKKLKIINNNASSDSDILRKKKSVKFQE